MADELRVSQQAIQVGFEDDLNNPLRVSQQVIQVGYSDIVIAESVLSSAGASTDAFVSAAISAATLSSAGASTDAFQSVSTAAAVLASVGAADAAFAGSFLADVGEGVLTSAGTATVALNAVSGGTPALDIPEVIGPNGEILHVYSDMHMQCPPSWYGGYKDGRIERSGYAERSLSDMVTGDPTSATFSYRLNDYDLFWHRALVSTDRRYLIDAVPVHMTTRANRALLGKQYLVFVGYVISIQPARPLSFEITLSDFISQKVITDTALMPWRLIGDGFIHDTGETALGFRAALSTVLDYNMPEPIIYGEHRRVRNVDEASQHGFEIDFTDHYLGIWDVGGGEKHVWIIGGHACGDLPDVNTVEPDGTHTSVIPDEGTSWWIPHHAGWLGIFGAPYVDLRSTSFGNDRRYTLILGAVGSIADRVAWTSGGYPMDPAPDQPLRGMAFVDGIEPNGDGSGDAYTIYADCYLDFMQNYGARSGPDSYQSGPRLTTPTVTVSWEDDPLPLIDEESFATVKAIHALRMPALGGYPCAAIIGAKPGDIHPVTKWIADWNRSGFCASGHLNNLAFRIVTPHPTQAAKDAARHLTDAYEIRGGSFEQEIRDNEQANLITFLNDPDYSAGKYMGGGKVPQGASVQNWDRAIPGEVREFPFAPGTTMGHHLAFLHAYFFADKPIHTTLRDTIGPDHLGDSLGYLKLGEWVTYTHYAQLGEPGQKRLGWAIRHQVQTGERNVLARLWDMEDLIGFDMPNETEAVSPGNDTCADAIVITVGADEAYAINQDTTDHATDPDVAGIAGLPGPAIGYHAAHYSYTPPANGTLFLTTVHSRYDTQIAVTTGDCGSLVLEEDGYNDNDGILTTSVLEVPVVASTTYHIIVYGFGPDDGGALTFGLLFTAA